MIQTYMVYPSDPKETRDFTLCFSPQIVAPNQLGVIIEAFPLAPEQLQCRTSLQREIIQEILQQPGQQWPPLLPQPTG